MEAFEKEIIERLKEMETLLREVRRDLNGNGYPGLIQDMSTVKQDIAILKEKQSWFGSSLSGWLTIIAWLLSFGLSLAALFLKRN